MPFHERHFIVFRYPCKIHNGIGRPFGRCGIGLGGYGVYGTGISRQVANGCGKGIPRYGALVTIMIDAKMWLSTLQCPDHMHDRCCEVGGIRGATLLIFYYGYFIAFFHQPQHGLYKIVTERAVYP